MSDLVAGPLDTEPAVNPYSLLEAVNSDSFSIVYSFSSILLLYSLVSSTMSMLKFSICK